MKSAEEIMEILEAYDLTGSWRTPNRSTHAMRLTAYDAETTRARLLREHCPRAADRSPRLCSASATRLPRRRPHRARRHPSTECGVEGPDDRVPDPLRRGRHGRATATPSRSPSTIRRTSVVGTGAYTAFQRRRRAAVVTSPMRRRRYRSQPVGHGRPTVATI